MPVLTIFSVYLFLICPALVISQDATITSSETELPSNPDISTFPQTDFDDVTYISRDLNGRLELITEDITQENNTATEANIGNNDPTETDQNSGEENFQSTIPLSAADRAATKQLTDGFKSDDVINGSATSGTDVTITEGHGSEIPVTRGSFESGMNGESTTTVFPPEELNDQENLFTGPDLDNHELFELSSPTEESWFGEDFDDVSTYKSTTEDESSKINEETVYTTLPVGTTSKDSTTGANIDQSEENISTENVSNYDIKDIENNNTEDDNKSSDNFQDQSEDVGTTTVTYFDVSTEVYDKYTVNQEVEDDDDFSSSTKELEDTENADEITDETESNTKESQSVTTTNNFSSTYGEIAEDITGQDEVVDTNTITETLTEIHDEDTTNWKRVEDDYVISSSTAQLEDTKVTDENENIIKEREEEIDSTTISFSDSLTESYNQITTSPRQIEDDEVISSSTTKFEDAKSTIDAISSEVDVNILGEPTISTVDSINDYEDNIQTSTPIIDETVGESTDNIPNIFLSTDRIVSEDVTEQNEGIYTTTTSYLYRSTNDEDSTNLKEVEGDDVISSSTAELEGTEATDAVTGDTENKSKESFTEQNEEIDTTTISYLDVSINISGEDTTNLRQAEDDDVISSSTTELEDTEATDEVTGENENKTKESSIKQDEEIDTTTISYLEASTSIFDEETTNIKQVEEADAINLSTTELEDTEITDEVIDEAEGRSKELFTEQDEGTDTTTKSLSTTELEDTVATDEVIGETEDETNASLTEQDEDAGTTASETETENKTKESSIEQDEEIDTTTISYLKALTSIYAEDTTNLKQVEEADAINLSTTELEDTEITDEVIDETEDRSKELFTEQDEGTDTTTRSLSTTELEDTVATDEFIGKTEEETNALLIEQDEDAGTTASETETGETENKTKESSIEQDEEIDTTTISYLEASTSIYAEDTTNLKQVEDADAISLSTTELEDTEITDEVIDETEDRNKESFTEIDTTTRSLSTTELEATVATDEVISETEDETNASLTEQDEDAGTTAISDLDSLTKIYDEDITYLKQVEDDDMITSTNELEDIEITDEVTDETEGKNNEPFTEQGEEIYTTISYDEDATKGNENDSENPPINFEESLTTEYSSEIDSQRTTYSKENDSIEDIGSEAYNTVSITTEYYEDLESTIAYSEEDGKGEETEKNEDNAEEAINEENSTPADENIVSNEDIASDKTVLQTTDVVIEESTRTRDDNEKLEEVSTDLPTSTIYVDENALGSTENEHSKEMGVIFREGKLMEDIDEDVTEVDSLSTMSERPDDVTEEAVDETTLYNYSEEKNVSTIDSVLETDTTVEYATAQNESESSTEILVEFSKTNTTEETTSERTYRFPEFLRINGDQFIEDLLNQLTNLIPDIENDTSLENLVENVNITSDYNQLLNNLHSYVSHLRSGNNDTTAEQATTEIGKDGEYLNATTIFGEQDNTTAVLDDIVPYVRWRVLQHEANISIKIITRDSTLYVPSTAYVFEDASNLTLNVTWQSPTKSLNNSLSLALTQIAQYYLINDVQLILVRGDEMLVWKKNGVVIPKNGTSEEKGFEFELEDGIHVYFSDNDIFMLPDMDNQIISGGQSTSSGKNGPHQVEIATGVTGVVATLAAIAYALLRVRKRAQQSKDISEYVAA